MKINGQLTLEDYLQAQYLHMRPGRLAAAVLYILLGLVVLGILGSLYPSIAAGDPIQSMIFILPFLVIILFIVLYYYVLFPRRVQRIYEQQKEMSASFEHEITPEGLASSNQYGYANRPWGNFRKWRENNDLFLLYLSDLQFIVLPKRFCTPEQLQAIRERLQANKIPEGGASYRGRFIAVGIYFAVLLVLFAALYVSFFSRAR